MGSLTQSCGTLKLFQLCPATSQIDWVEEERLWGRGGGGRGKRWEELGDGGEGAS